jgi:hypothetical protein
LATLLPQQVHVTAASGGEMLRNFELARGDLDLLDRGYCTPQDIDYADLARGDVIVRFARQRLPLRDATGRPVDVVSRVLRLRRPGQVRAWRAWVQTERREVPVRVIAVRLKPEAARRAQARLRRETDGPVSAADLEWAKYLVLVTTVPKARLSDRDVLALFRLRWQGELQIKRDKSLGGLDRLPNFRDDTVASWICGKLLAQALARGLIAPVPFPPGAGRTAHARAA